MPHCCMWIVATDNETDNGLDLRHTLVVSQNIAYDTTHCNICNAHLNAGLIYHKNKTRNYQEDYKKI